MKNIVKSAKGAISVFVALMMAGILSLGTFVLEAARFQAAKTQLAEATISASSSMLSSYNSDLKDRYGIVALDTQRSDSIVCRSYLDFNSDLASGFFGNNLTRLYSLENVSMKGVYNLTYPHILKRQLLTVAKYNIVPEDSQFNMYTASYALEDLQMKCEYVSEKMQEILNKSKTGSLSSLSSELQIALSVLDKTFVNIKKYNDKYNITITDNTFGDLPSNTGTYESDIPEEDESNIAAVLNDATKFLGASASVLQSSSIAVNDEIDRSINLTALNELDAYHNTTWSGDFEQTELVELIYVGTNAGASGTVMPYHYKNLADDIYAAINKLKEDFDGNLLLNSYISQKISNRNYTIDKYAGPGEGAESSKENMTFAKACCEYVFGGEKSETGNQREAYDYIMAFRLIGNLYHVLQESTSLDLNNTYSIAAHLAWAYYETCLDVELVTNYNTPVPLTKDSLVLQINNPSSVTSAFASLNIANGLRSLGYYNAAIDNFVIGGVDNLNYTDSLGLALWFVPNSKKLLKVADLIQLEMRYKQQYIDKIPATFLMKEQNTYCRVECNAKMNSILPIISIGGTNHSIQGHSFKSVKYAGY